MAILSSGILGFVSGKTGPVISYTRYGQNITRTVGSTRKNKIETPVRKAQRDKIKVCNQFTKAFAGTHFFDRTFPDPTHTGSGDNRATSALMNLAIVITTKTIISWPKVLISKGELAPVDFATATVNEEGNIAFTWLNNAGTGTAKGTDKAVLVAYFHECKEVVFKFSEVTRNEDIAVLETDSKKETQKHGLALSRDEKNAANSIYCGRVALI